MAGGEIRGSSSEAMSFELGLDSRAGFQRAGMWAGGGGALQRQTDMGKDGEVRKYWQCSENIRTSLSRM